MPIDDFLNTAQPPMVGPDDLGVPQLPAPPQAPMAPQPKTGTMQMLLQALPGILGGAMGPGAGTGLLQGYVQGERVNEAQAQQQYRDAQDQYRLDQHAYDQQAQQAAMLQRSREQILQQTLSGLREAAAKAPDKAAYDGLVDAYANGLRMMGFNPSRIDANFLRKSVPYAAPGAEKIALEIYERWIKDPLNKKMVDENPAHALNALVPVPGWMGKGEATPHKSIREIRALAGIAADGPDGPVVAPKDRSLTDFTGEMRNYLAQYIAEDKANGVQQDDKRFAENVQRAQTAADQQRKAAPSPSDKWSPKQVATFNQIAGAYDRSPLVRAADRTLVLEDAVKTVEATPSDPAAQLRLAYSYIQALDTYQSAVREGELGNLGMLGTKLQQWQMQLNKVANEGAFLPPEVARAIARDGRQLVQVIASAADRKQKEFSSRAKVSGIGEMWDEFVAGMGQTSKPAPTEPSRGGGPKVGERRKFGEQLGEWDGQGWILVEP